MGRTDFSDQFRKIIIRHKRIGHDLNVIRQSACLLINRITESLLHQGLSEPEFYGDLVYKFKKIRGMTDFF